jgi:hypothetical protein
MVSAIHPLLQTFSSSKVEKRYQKDKSNFSKVKKFNLYFTILTGVLFNTLGIVLMAMETNGFSPMKYVLGILMGTIA